MTLKANEEQLVLYRNKKKQFQAKIVSLQNVVGD